MPTETPVTIPVEATTEAVPTALLLQVPPAVRSDREIVDPTHTPVEPEMATGCTLTVIVVVAVLLQPAVVPVTVYLFTPSDGVKATPSLIPPVQLYDAAPVPLKVAIVPLHIARPPPVIPTVGIAFTVIVDVAVLEQPLVVPVTV